MGEDGEARGGVEEWGKKRGIWDTQSWRNCTDIDEGTWSARMMGDG